MRTVPNIQIAFGHMDLGISPDWMGRSGNLTRISPDAQTTLFSHYTSQSSSHVTMLLKNIPLAQAVQFTRLQSGFRGFFLFLKDL